MQKYYILVILATSLNLSTAKASLSRDSIGVENLNGKKLILHKIDAKETYYSLGRRYGVNHKDIMTFNDNKYLQIGTLIKVPTQIPFHTIGTGNPARPSATVPARETVNSATETGANENLTIIEHTVQRKENLNMLAEKYGTTVNEIKQLNGLRSIGLQIGQILKIPSKITVENVVVENPATASPQTNSTSTGSYAPVQIPEQYRKKKTAKTQETPEKVAQQEEFLSHTVASNETMYSIATRYNLTMDQLKAKNNLSNNSLYVGQKLLIKGQYPVVDLNNEANDSEESDADSLGSVKNPSLRLPPSRYGLSQLDEKGTATWITDPDLDSSKMLVLHRTAPVGTIMKITNPMTNRSTFAKVIGKFTENASTKDVIIVMTKAVADSLGALDKRFFCNITYSGQANEQQ